MFLLPRPFAICLSVPPHIRAFSLPGIAFPARGLTPHISSNDKQTKRKKEKKITPQNFDTDLTVVSSGYRVLKRHGEELEGVCRLSSAKLLGAPFSFSLSFLIV